MTLETYITQRHMPKPETSYPLGSGSTVGMQSAQPQPVSMVEGSIDRLSLMNSELGGVLNRLADRLQPVLMPEAPTNESQAAKPGQPFTPLVAAIDTVSDSLAMKVAGIDSLLRRLAL